MARGNSSSRSSSLHLEALETREVPAAIGALDPSFGAAGKVLASRRA